MVGLSLSLPHPCVPPPHPPPGSQGNIWEQIFRVSFILEMINTLPFIITVGELLAEAGATGTPSP